jgi:hypothetical protein
MSDQYGVGVAEGIAKKREESTLEALSATNRLSRYSIFMCVYAVTVFIIWTAYWYSAEPVSAAAVFTTEEHESFRNFSYAAAGAFAASFVFQACAMILA